MAEEEEGGKMDRERETPDLKNRRVQVGLGTGTDNRTGIFYRHFTPEPVYCTCIPEYTMLQSFALSLSLSSYINGHSQEFDFYARFRGFLVALPRAYWQER